MTTKMQCPDKGPDLKPKVIRSEEIWRETRLEESTDSDLRARNRQDTGTGSIRADARTSRIIFKFLCGLAVFCRVWVWKYLRNCK